MALSDDQRALLRLLAQREQGYEDIAALKGLSVEQVREEVRAALAALDAPPPEPAPPPPEPTPPPAPQPGPEPQPARAAAAKPAVRKPTRPQVPVERRRLLLFAGGALAIVAVVLGAIALFGGGSDSDPGTAASATGTELTAAEEEKVTQAVLSPPTGGDAAGRAVFGRLGKEEIVLQVTAEGLEPSQKGTPYTIWLYRNPKLSLRVGTVQVGDSGELGARLPIPTELLAYVAGGAFDQVYVSRTSNADYKREVARAKRDKAIPRYVGETVLSGKITGPIAEGAASQGN
jgi:hypothetical protein